MYRKDIVFHSWYDMAYSNQFGGAPAHPGTAWQDNDGSNGDVDE
jgi:hypothetical protein